ncbi:hypothetical protein CAEBREN_11785 [Caenorhabditis brenneri]|uniref:Uncharacterized protein n=1 Tax=Caenorhabditis brenneri TaxID=135651 RepID=G0N7F6_CAEBE|nr:hypothetical protein CAEBREN_11785 [Caenorhabditis brenneri]
MSTRKEKRQLWMDGWKKNKKTIENGEQKKKKKQDKFAAMKTALNIPHIYEAIFDGQTDLKRMMELRLVNKTFNLLFIHRIYDLFKTVKITTEDGKILIHGISLKLNSKKKKDQFLPFMKFLRDEVRVEPKKLQLMGLGKVSENYHKQVHDGIITMFGGQASKLTELTGLAEICEFGCKKCNQLAKNCTKYYPITVQDIVDGFGRVIHTLKEIKFSDRELFHCAQKLIDAGGQVKISRDIVCDHFILTLIEGQTEDRVLQASQKTQGVPIEVLNRILENLSPKTLEIKISKSIDPEEIRRYKSGYFTEVQLGKPVPKNAQLTRKFEKFHLDLTDSQNFPEKMEGPFMFFGDIVRIRNVLILVKAEHYTITLPRNFLSFSKFDSNFETILKNVWSCTSSRNQKIDVHFFPEIEIFGVGEAKYSGIVKYQGDELAVEIEDVQLKMLKDAPENPFKEHNFIGKKFFIRNPETNCDVNIFCWVERESYHRRYYQERVLPVWFLDGEHGPDCKICRQPRADRHWDRMRDQLREIQEQRDRIRDELNQLREERRDLEERQINLRRLRDQHEADWRDFRTQFLFEDDQELVEAPAQERRVHHFPPIFHRIPRRQWNRQNRGLPMRMGRRFN